MTKWKLRVQHCRSHCGDDDDDELLTNSRYVDDLMLYARTGTDQASMIESLVEEVAAVGLQLNTSKTKRKLTIQNLKKLMFFDMFFPRPLFGSVPLTCSSFFFVAMEACVLADATASVPCNLVLTSLLELWTNFSDICGDMIEVLHEFHNHTCFNKIYLVTFGIGQWWTYNIGVASPGWNSMNIRTRFWIGMCLGDCVWSVWFRHHSHHLYIVFCNFHWPRITFSNSKLSKNLLWTMIGMNWCRTWNRKWENESKIGMLRPWIERLLVGKLRCAAKVASEMNSLALKTTESHSYQKWKVNYCAEPCKRNGRPTKRWDDQMQFFAQKMFHSSWFKARQGMRHGVLMCKMCTVVLETLMSCCGGFPCPSQTVALTRTGIVCLWAYSWTWVNKHCMHASLQIQMYT